MSRSLGDPDDAMRLVLVRDLLAGRSWYDQLVTRLQPPFGVFMHWSRLLDGALAASIWTLRLFLPPAWAESAVRFFWPMAWTVPAVFCGLAISRRLGGTLAVFVCVVLLAANQSPFADFRPGRIDHHNVQIALLMIAAASAIAGVRRERWALVAGFATGLGLAIGMEALPFHALIGASYALEAVRGRDETRTTQNYAFALVGSTLFFYGAETPAARWSLSFCDAIGLNLIVAVAISAGGLLVVARVRTSTRIRALIMTVTAIAAAAAYLAFNPQCIRGPLGAVDPRIRPFWFDRVDELSPITTMLRKNFNAAIAALIFSALALGSAVLLIRREWPQATREVVLASAFVFVAVPASLAAFRMEYYVLWLGFPVLASGMAIGFSQYWRGLMLPSAIAAVVLSPIGVGAATRLLTSTIGHSVQSPPRQVHSRCDDPAAYRRLAELPPGVVLAEVTIGPYVLVTTRDSVIAAPYHRMVWGILAAHEALTSPVASAEPKVRALKATYVVVCRSSGDPAPRGSIQRDLASDRRPAWLDRISGETETLQIFRTTF